MNNKQQIVVLFITAGASAGIGGEFLSYFIFQGSIMGFSLGLLFMTIGIISVLKGTDLLNNLD